MSHRSFGHADSRMKINMADDKDEKRWKWSLDIQNTPCARESLALGISSSLIIGGLVFLKSKKVRKSCDYAVGSFVLLSLVSWEVCSLNRYRKREKIKKAVSLLNDYEKKRAQHSELEPTET